MRGTEYSRRLFTVMLIGGSLAVLAMMVVVAFNIFGRWLDRPITGAIEVAGLCGAIVAAVAIPFNLKERRSVVVDVLASRLPERVRGFFDTFNFLLCLAAAVLLAWAAWREALHAASFNEKTLVALAPTSPFKFIWAIGLVILGAVLARDVVTAFRKGVKR
ncbi:MAG: TRAP transporter small permease [Thermoleophilia bacterium]|nr:TRAP transporter small permease [Thermoleophilia bacterium]